MTGLDGTTIIAGAALMVQTVGLALTIQRSAATTRQRIEDLRVELAQVRTAALTRPDLDAALDRERSGWDSRCARHEARCEEDRQRLHDRLSALAKRVQL